MSHRVFVINPGSTTTKLAVFQGEMLLCEETVEHMPSELAAYDTIWDQLELRLPLTLDFLSRHGVELPSLDIVMGRGGMFPPMRSGGYLVDQAMLDLVRYGDIQQHASNLGAPLAWETAQRAGVRAYIYDAVSVDEFPPIAKITGIPEVERQSFCHVLNSKAVARKYAEGLGKRYEDVNVIVSHLGGGITVSAHKNGRIVDSLADDAGAFAPERSGSMSFLYVIDLCYSGQYTKDQMKKRVRGRGGLLAHLGTSDCREVERRISAGDEHARLIYDAMIYQIAKGITLVIPALDGHVDAVLLTGGAAHSRYIVQGVERHLGGLFPVAVFPGGYEMEALAAGGVRILDGEPTHRLSPAGA